MELIKKQNQMVVSYSTIGANTFNVLVFDLKTKRNLFNFEMFALSEDHSMGFLLSTNDYLIMT